MPEIRHLPEDVVSKIAAGEVIERPASVLKELLENALDAGATRVEVEVRKAGRGLIRVHDDGRGMDREDLRLALGRHATSKISSFDDLWSLATFGFRGEALYSIFAVSRLKLASCRQGAPSGYEIEGEGGRVSAEVPSPPVKGTTVEVSDLFFNTPARAKFMKSDASERAHLIKTVEEAALSNPGTAFRLVIDETEILSLPVLPGGLWDNLSHRAAAIFGKAVFKGLVRLERRLPGMAVYGYASGQDAFGATRGNQYFFVNRRPVASAMLRQALYKGYPSAQAGRHPACALFVELDPASFDCNIHPQKRDVKFSAESEVFRAVSGAVHEAMLPAPGAAPAAPAAPQAPVFGGGLQLSPQAPEAAAEPAALFGEAVLPAAEARPAGTEDWRVEDLSYIGQLARSYLVFECARGLLLVDQHAAQERVYYEKYMDEFAAGAIKVQPLIIPLEAELSRSQMENVLRWKDWLATAGFELEARGPAIAQLRSAPALFYFTPASFSEFLSYLADVLGDPGRAAEDMKRGVVATMACKKAIKARDFVKPQEAVRLMDDLRRARDGNHCPHGRPTMFYLAAGDLARRFGRSSAL